MLAQPDLLPHSLRPVSIHTNAAALIGKSEYLMEKFNTHEVTLGIKKLIKQQELKQKKDMAPNSKEFHSWFLLKVINNDKNNSLRIWILYNPKIWGTHLNRHEV